MTRRDVYVVICAFNEQSRLPSVLKSLAKYVSVAQIIVVDDGSDIPLRLAAGSAGWLLRHNMNLGKGAAMKTGADFAFEQGAKAVVFMDADGQHAPAELPVFIHHLHSGKDIVLGTRSNFSKTPLVRLLGNRFASIYLLFVFGIYVRDVLCGYRGLSYKAYRHLKWESSRYGVETEMIARLGGKKKLLTWTEIPVATIYKDKYKGVTLIQAIKILGDSIWWKLS